MDKQLMQNLMESARKDSFVPDRLRCMVVMEWRIFSKIATPTKKAAL